MRKRNLPAASVVVWLFCTCLSAVLAAGNRTPNVLLVMTDTQRVDDMGAFGNPLIKTPHLDRLANEGVKFTHCYTQHPACMPARATLFTGRYAMAHGVWSNGVPLPTDEVTLAHVLADRGYRTGGAGKFHFLPHFPYRKAALPTMKSHPQPFYGFQEFHLGEDGRSGEHWQWMQEQHPEYLDKPDHEIPLELHNSYWSASHTIRFIRDCAARKAPFFAFCSFVDPHQSYNPPSPYREMYDPQAMPEPIGREGELANSRFKDLAASPNVKRYTDNWRREKAQHYGEMTFIDDSVGRIVRALEECGLREETLIVFVADHGDMLGDHGLWWKGDFHYKNCANVPLFFNWPGHLQAGKTVSGMCQQTDVMPTILDLVNLAVPPGVQGRSLKAVLTGDSEETGYDYAFIASISSGAYSPDYFDGRGKRQHQDHRRAVDTYTLRNHRWRFTFYTSVSEGELYDLAKDPQEFDNLWDEAAYQSVKRDLMVVLFNRLASARDPLPEKIRPY
jgi:arylsulfatase A-like enzyme